MAAPRTLAERRAQVESQVAAIQAEIAAVKREAEQLGEPPRGSGRKQRGGLTGGQRARREELLLETGLALQKTLAARLEVLTLLHRLELRDAEGAKDRAP
jgi:hypothetical protein